MVTKVRRLEVEHFGPIRRADVALGDLTVCVGPQASGKTLFWQLFKLLLDDRSVRADLARFNIDWGQDPDVFRDLYFGEGTRRLFDERTVVRLDERASDLRRLAGARRPRAGAGRKEKVFYVPAQRVLALRDGTTRPFSDYQTGDPFVLREFSDRLHHLVQSEFARAETLFPQGNRLDVRLRELLNDAVFRGFHLVWKADRHQKRLFLRHGETELPFLVWSAGQREFVPLLLGLYWLMPAGGVSCRNELRWVIIEEPEMGLHPRAISSFMLLVLGLLERGYRVGLSTHSPHVLDVVWGLRVLKDHGGEEKDVRKMLGGIPSTPKTKEIAERALRKEITVHYFKPHKDGVVTVDVSGLDPGSERSDEAEWGGLTGFTATVGDVVAEVVARHEGGRGHAR